MNQWSDMPTIDEHLNGLQDGIRIRQEKLDAMERQVKDMQEIREEIKALNAAMKQLAHLASPQDVAAEDAR